MNLLCPNCQKPLTVPEQYAGQPMRCPLCQGTFTVPALPPSSTPPLPPAAVPPAATPDVYGVADAGAPPPPPPMPNFDVGGAPPKPSAVTAAPPPSPPSGPTTGHVEGEPTYPTVATPEGYQGKYTSWFSPKVLMYFAPVAVFLIFVLSFFPWTGVYPGGVASAWQNGWQAIYGGWSCDADIISMPAYKPFSKGYEPGWNFLLLFYIFLLLVPTLPVTIGCLALEFVPTKQLPPAAHQVLPWRWGIVAALNLILLLFLMLQLVLGFSLENNYIAAKDKAVADAAKAREQPATTLDNKSDAIERGLGRQAVSRTMWLDLVVILSILAVLSAGLMFWLTRRGGRPAPQITVLW
jgi:hypothetical protein